jgi:hypothetical protein
VHGLDRLPQSRDQRTGFQLAIPAGIHVSLRAAQNRPLKTARNHSECVTPFFPQFIRGKSSKTPLNRMAKDRIVHDVFASPEGDSFFLVERDVGTRVHSVARLDVLGKVIWRKRISLTTVVKSAVSLDERVIVVGSFDEYVSLDGDGREEHCASLRDIDQIISTRSGVYIQAEGKLCPVGDVCPIAMDALPNLISVAPDNKGAIWSSIEEHVLIMATGKRVAVPSSKRSIMHVHWASLWVLVCESGAILQVMDRRSGARVTQLTPPSEWHYVEVYFDEKNSLLTACALNGGRGDEMRIELLYFDGETLTRDAVHQFPFAPVFGTLFAKGTRYATGMGTVIDCFSGSQSAFA